MGVLSLDTEKYQKMLCQQEAMAELLDKQIIEETENLLSGGQSFSDVGESFLDDEPCWTIDTLLLKVYLAFTRSSMNQRMDRERSVADLVKYMERHIEKVALKKAKEELKRRQNDFEEPYSVESE